MFIVVLFNLKPGVSVAEYEEWATGVDIPGVRRMKSIAAFDVFRLEAVRGSGAAPPDQYVELLEVADEEQFKADVSTDAQKAVSARFRELADNPLFINSTKLGA